MPIDSSLIASGFDLELNLGGGFIQAAISSLFDAEAVVTEFALGAFTLNIERPNDVTIVVGEAHHLEVRFPATSSVPGFVPPGGAGLLVALNVTPVVDEDTGLNDGATIQLQFVDFTPDWLERFNALQIAALLPAFRAQVAAAFDRPLPNIVPGQLEQLEVVVLPGDALHQPCIALLINLKLKIGPLTSGDVVLAAEPDSAPIPRGTIAAAQSFLPAEHHVAMGAPPALFTRLATDLMHSFTRTKADGTLYRPLLERVGTKDVVRGQYESVMISAHSGSLLVRSIVILEAADIPVTADIFLHPTLTAGELDFDIEVLEPEADIGLFEAVLMFIMAAPMTSAGLAIGSLGVAFARMEKEWQEGKAHRQIEARVENEQAEFLAFLAAIPNRVSIVRQRIDPFFSHHFQAVTAFSEMIVSNAGLAFGGTASSGEQDLPERVVLTGRRRRNEPLDLLWRLQFDVPRRNEIPPDDSLERDDPVAFPNRFSLTEEDALARVPLGHLWPVHELVPSKVKGSGAGVDEIKFDTGVALAPYEAGRLQLAGLLHVNGYRLIQPVGRRPYYRSVWPDGDLANNLASLPHYRSYRSDLLAERLLANGKLLANVALRWSNGSTNATTDGNHDLAVAIARGWATPLEGVLPGLRAHRLIASIDLIGQAMTDAANGVPVSITREAFGSLVFRAWAPNEAPRANVIYDFARIATSDSMVPISEMGERAIDRMVSAPGLFPAGPKPLVYDMGQALIVLLEGSLRRFVHQMEVRLRDLVNAQ